MYFGGLLKLASLCSADNRNRSRSARENFESAKNRKSGGNSSTSTLVCRNNTHACQSIRQPFASIEPALNK